MPSKKKKAPVTTAPAQEEPKAEVQDTTSAPAESQAPAEQETPQQTSSPESSETDGYEVIKIFRDAEQYAVDGKRNMYQVGADVSHFDAERLKDLVKRKLVKKA